MLKVSLRIPSKPLLGAHTSTKNASLLGFDCRNGDINCPAMMGSENLIPIFGKHT